MPKTEPQGDKHFGVDLRTQEEALRRRYENGQQRTVNPVICLESPMTHAGIHKTFLERQLHKRSNF